MAGMVSPGDARGLTRELVRIDSQNPSLVPGGVGEQECARTLESILGAWGFRTERFDAAPGRSSVIARIGKATNGRRLMFNGHLDVVGVEGMTHDPFDPVERDGLLFGRGSADMKGGVAALCAAAWRAAHAGLDGEIIVAAVADEEFNSLGTRAVIARGVRADAAIVAEPTKLSIMPAHRGFIWAEVDITGRAAHGSRWDIGVDAIRHAGLLLAELDRIDAEVLPLRTHPLLGRGSLHASFIEGGVGMSTYPGRCVLKIERRSIPGEGQDELVAEIERACAAVRARRPSFAATVKLLLAQGPSDVHTEAPVVTSLSEAILACGERVVLDGMSAWTDCALLNDAGIPAVCYGPGDISLAHAAEEYIPLSEIDRATDVLTALALRWCN
jgi:acetylornithine deacetylase